MQCGLSQIRSPMTPSPPYPQRRARCPHCHPRRRCRQRGPGPADDASPCRRGVDAYGDSFVEHRLDALRAALRAAPDQHRGPVGAPRTTCRSARPSTSPSRRLRRPARRSHPQPAGARAARIVVGGKDKEGRRVHHLSRPANGVRISPRGAKSHCRRHPPPPARPRAASGRGMRRLQSRSATSASTSACRRAPRQRGGARGRRGGQDGHDFMTPSASRSRRPRKPRPRPPRKRASA